MATNQNSKTSQNTTITTTSQTSKSSSEIIVNNDDLLKQILLKLPLKSLIKLTSVSKHWLSLISDPDFSRRRSPFPCSASGLLLRRPYSVHPIVSMPGYNFVDLNQTNTNAPFRFLTFFDDPYGIEIVQSCNGLLLCSPESCSDAQGYVYNPTTKKYTVLPPLPRRCQIHCGFSLAFDPSKSLDYKVVCVWRNLDHNYHIEIYSSKTRTWRLSGDSFDANDTIQFGGGVFWNGAVNWLSFSKHSLYFNVDEERLSQMSLPPLPEHWLPNGKLRNLRYFGESHGHLHIINHVNDPTTLELDVYEMRMDYSGWFVKFRVDYSEFPTAFPEIIPSQLDHQNLDCCLFSVVHIYHSDVDEESYAVIRIQGKIIRYNFMSKTLDGVCDIENMNVSRSAFYVYQYIESLALV
ncbi:hypothetical protein UlMin_000164 [Ulmus minor]